MVSARRAIEEYLGGPSCSIVSERNAAMAAFALARRGWLLMCRTPGVIPVLGAAGTLKAILYSNF